VVDGKVSSPIYSAGVVGYSNASTIISRCVNFCDVTIQSVAGGITSRLNDNCVIEYCINLGTINAGSSQTAGIAGDGQAVTQIRNNLNLGNVYSTNTNKTGGICGDNTNDNIINCINAGFIPNGNCMFGDDYT
jgi:hypothetical protein